MSTDTTTAIPDVYAITLRIAGEKGATDTTKLTEAITSAVAALDEDTYGIYVVQPVVAEKVDLLGSNARLISEHLTYAVNEAGLDGEASKIAIERTEDAVLVDLTEPTTIAESEALAAEVTEHHRLDW